MPSYLQPGQLTALHPFAFSPEEVMIGIVIKTCLLDAIIIFVIWDRQLHCHSIGKITDGIVGILEDYYFLFILDLYFGLWEDFYEMLDCQILDILA